MNFFPPSLGLDISESALKAIMLAKRADGFFDLVFAGQSPLKEGAVKDGEIKSADDFARAFSSILENKRNIFLEKKCIVASLPEEEAFLRVLEMPASLKKEEMAETLKYEIEANIPVSLDEVYYDYEILSHTPMQAHNDIMVNAVPKRIVDSYVNFFNKHDYQLVALEMESVALKRALFYGIIHAPNDAVLVLDMGRAKGSFMIVVGGVLRFTSSSPVGSNRFNSAISEHFSVDLKEAELIKRIVGLDKNQKKGRELLEILLPDLVTLKEQIQSHVNFFETHTAKDELSQGAQKISKIILSGGGAGLWGLADWLSQELRMVVTLANPLKRIKNRPFNNASMSMEDSLAYAMAIGLALRNFEELA